MARRIAPNVQLRNFNIGLKNWRKSGEIWLHFGEKVAILSIHFVAPKVAILRPQFGSLEKNKLETLGLGKKNTWGKKLPGLL